MSVWSTAGLLVRAVRDQSARDVNGALVTALPGLVAAVILRRRIVADEQELVSTSLLRTRRIPWSHVRRLDQTRVSFAVFTEGGTVSAGLISGQQRERLLRLILQQARLMPAPASCDLRWGIIARYVPRAQPIEFKPREGQGR